ncbi:hypothetical protein FH972_026315 [Carpinus fangiana]|uniref:Target of rapamycin complex subunit LST8 n=1 Tax=Carpinus fangiana TaxID=176857 RepID=A0A5N6L3N6_9ROSI|nr:hypothetical protein FH972_026315 [Carpinus fangiana]
MFPAKEAESGFVAYSLRSRRIEEVQTSPEEHKSKPDSPRRLKEVRWPRSRVVGNIRDSGQTSISGSSARGVVRTPSQESGVSAETGSHPELSHEDQFWVEKCSEYGRMESAGPVTSDSFKSFSDSSQCMRSKYDSWTCLPDVSIVNLLASFVARSFCICPMQGGKKTVMGSDSNEQTRHQGASAYSNNFRSSVLAAIYIQVQQRGSSIINPQGVDTSRDVQDEVRAAQRRHPACITKEVQRNGPAFLYNTANIQPSSYPGVSQGAPRLKLDECHSVYWYAPTLVHTLFELLANSYPDTAGYDHTIRFWEALSGICQRTIQHPDSQINRLCISPDKKYLAAAGHHTVKLFEVKGSNPQPVLTFEGHTNNITGVAFHCEAKWMVTSSEDGTVKIWDTKTATVQRDYKHGSPVNDVVIHPNQGELISCDRGGSVRIWDLSENKCSHQLVPEEDISVASVTVASDGSLLCAGNNLGNVYVWRLLQTLETTTLVPVCKFGAHGTYITRVLLSPDIKHLATCSADHTTRIWSVDTSRPSPFASASTSSLSSNTSNAPGKAQIANPTSHQRNDRALTAGPPSSTPGGAPGGGTAPEPGAFPLEMTLAQHQRWVWDCAFSADSQYLVTSCSDHYARLWDLSNQQIIRQYNGHHRGAVCVALNDYSDLR